MCERFQEQKLSANPCTASCCNIWWALLILWEIFQGQTSLWVHTYRLHEQSGHRPSLDTPSRSPISSVGNVSLAVHYVISELTQPPPSVKTHNVQILTSSQHCSEHQEVLKNTELEKNITNKLGLSCAELRSASLFKGSHHKKNGKIWEKYPNRLDPPTPIGNFRLFWIDGNWPPRTDL